MIDVIREYEATGSYQYNEIEQNLATQTYGEVCFKPTIKEMSSRATRPSLWVVKDIKKGDELSYDYGFGYDADFRQFPCKCGSKNCCGYIVRDDQRWRINRKYAKTKQGRLNK